MAEEIDRSVLPIRRRPSLPVECGYAERSPFECTGKISRVVFDVNPHLTEEDRHAIHEHEHEHEQHAAVAHGIGA